MNKSPSGQQYVKMVDGPIEPSGLGFGYPLVGAMSIFLIITNAYSFRQATRLPALIGLLVAILLLAVKMYMLRRRPSHERATSGGLDRMLGYLAPATISIVLSAFAIYSFFVAGDDAASRQPARKRLENAVVVTEDYYHQLRTRIRNRIELNAERLREIQNEPPSPSQQQKVASLEEEQQRLRSLYGQVAEALRPDESDSPSPDDSPDGANPSDGTIDEDTVDEKVRKRQLGRSSVIRPADSRSRSFAGMSRLSFDRGRGQCQPQCPRRSRKCKARTRIPLAPARFQIEGAPAGFFVQFELAGGEVKSLKLEQGPALSLTLLPKRT